MREFQRKIIRTIAFSFAFGITFLFIGLLISFPFYYLGVRNPYLNKIPGIVIDPAAYQAELTRLGVFERPEDSPEKKYVIHASEQIKQTQLDFLDRLSQHPPLA